MHAEAAYDELIRRSREQALLASCAALLTWDEETYMPPGGLANRADQLALLAGLQHGMATDPRIGELLGELEGSALVRDPFAPAAVNIRELRRQYHRLTRLPRTLVEELTRVSSFAQQEWAAARQHADFARFRPWLEKVVALKRREADCVGYETVPYDALLEEYEPGTRAAELAVLFDALRRELLPLINALTYARHRPNVAILRREFPVDRQRLFAERAAATLGFDFRSGRLDTTAHPFFCTIGPADIRIATRYHPCYFGDAFFGTLHEVGHALYEQGLDPEYYGTPMGDAPSLALHESQARLWENTVGRSLAFWKHFFPLARQTFPQALHDVTLDEFHFAVNHVEATLIRVSADEVTYNLHILIRFELEQALVAGDLRVADLPAAWDEAYRHYLGVVPADDAQGCLQDCHWGAGLIGYFPTYTLGNLYAAQLFARASTDLGDLEAEFARGDFRSLLDWLRDRVHRQGRRHPAAQLIEQATGSLPDHRALVQALRHKYGELYRIV
jgi:carboxypeptidase Taq